MGCLRHCLPLVLVASAQAGPMAEHPVARGDTLISVRDRLLHPGIGWRQLQAVNRVPDPLRLRPGSVLRFPADWLREQPAQAEVLQLHGTVWLERAGRRTALAAGDTLRDGDLLVSDAQSSATLRFADGTRSLVRPFTQIELRQLRQLRAGSARSELQLKQGALDAEVPPAPQAKGAAPRLQIRTPVANLGVRGTRLRSHWQGERLLLEVVEGRVEAAAAGAARAESVAAGEGWVSGQGREALLPAPALLGAVPARIERLPAQLQWPALPGAQAYRVQWFDAQGQQLLLDETTPGAQFIGAAELPDGDYRLRVRARSASGLEGQDAEAPVQLAARPEPPVLEAPPAAAQVVEERLRFAWTRPQGAARWRLQVADETGFASPRVDDTQDSAERGLALPPGVHHWRVASVRADGRQGPWSDAQTLVRVPPPPNPPPPPESRRDGDRLQLRWAASPLAGARYQLQADRADGDFSTPWFDQQLDAAEALLPLSQRGPQQLRIRTLGRDGRPGPWGAVQQFEGLSAPRWWLLALPLLLAL